MGHLTPDNIAAENCAAIDVSTIDAVFTAPSRVYVGGAGNVTVIPLHGGTPVLFTAPPVGSTLPVLCSGVKHTGTSATALVQLF